MKFRLEAFWLILLTVGGNQKQLGTDCCHARSTWGLAAAAATATATATSVATAATEQKSNGNEMENAMKLRETTEQTKRPLSVAGDITTTTTIQPQTVPDATTFTAKPFAHLALKQAKGLSLDLNIKQRVAKLLASAESDASEASEEDGAATTMSDEGDASESSSTSTHHPGRRHVVPDKLQYTKEIQIKQGRLMGITRRFQVTSGLGEVDQYLGIPYAEAPIGSRRFMPPGE